MNEITLTRISVPVSIAEREELRIRASEALRDPREHARYLLRQALGLSSAENDNRPATDRQALSGAIVSNP